ncbi:MAG: MoxR family ATPase [Candidatus Sericytochromatia bacterium]
MDYHNKVEILEKNLNNIIKGKSEVIKLIITAILAKGHILLEDIPGVGKTTLSKAIAKSINAKFNRIQFTPDLLPTDILGSPIYNPKDGTFEFKKGPIFCNILLADEINRASPRTQSGLLECMSETQVTMEGKSYKLDNPFFVLATQNPVESHGTYPLPDAQMDRFAIQLSVGYPNIEEEINIFYAQEKTHPLENITPILSCEEINEIQKKITEITVERSIAKYIMEIVSQTRNNPLIKLGVSPRGSLMFFSIIKAKAFLEKRTFCLPDDVKNLAVSVLAHRISLETKAKYSGVKKTDLILDILNKTPVPR